jgi:glycosyltransferase involved in cell wall biosynthesis
MEWKRPMRVLTLCYEYPPLGGGGGRVAHGLARTLVSMGHEVDVVTMGFRNLPSDDAVDGVRIRRVSCLRRSAFRCTVPEAASYLAGARRTALTLAGSGRYELIHAHFLFPDGWLAYHLRRRTGLPFIATAHGSDVPGYNPHRLKLAHLLLSPIWKRVVHEASRIVCPSQTLASLVRRGAPAARTCVVPNGIMLSDFDPGRERDKTVLCATRLLPRKGVQHVVASMGKLPPEWRLVVAGDGPFLPELRRLAAPLSGRVTFAGWLDNASREYRSLFETSGIFALPSDAENFPVSLLEAMAAGMPIVTTRGTGCEEVVGDSALLVPAGDPAATGEALSRLAGDAALRFRLGDAARARVEDRFSWEAVTSAYLGIYREAAGTGNADDDAR